MTKKSISRLLQASLMCCLAVLFTACDDIFASEDNPTPAYLSMSDKPVTIKVGDTYRRKAISVTSAVVEYTSSDTNVATVDGEGMVTAIAEGTTTITATATGYSSQNGKKIYQPASVSYVVTVKPATLPAATITTAPVATTGDIAAGSETALVTAGVADGGTIMYRVTPANEAKPTTTDGFSATVPTAATRAGGTYCVWYYAKGDAEHSDSEIAAIEVTVKAIYLKWDNTKKELVATLMPDTYTTVESSASGVNWSAGTYVVEGDVDINGNIKLKGNVELIIKDGCKLTVYGRINGNMSCDLNVYGGKAMSGELAVYRDYDAITNIVAFNIHSCKVIANCTSSTGDCGGVYAVSVLNVYGGLLDAQYTGESGVGYGICLTDGGSLNIYGGEVIAVGNGTNENVSYGICVYGSTGSGTVHFYGGKLYAACDSKSAFKSNVTLNVTTGKMEYSSNGNNWDQTVSVSALSGKKFVRIGYSTDSTIN